MKSLRVLFLALVLVVSTFSFAYAQNMYGSLAYSYQTGDWGWAVDYPTQGQANYQALYECGHTCQVVLEFHNTCAAFALGDYGAYGWAWGPNPDQVQDSALDYCLQNAGSCEIVNWACTSRY